MNAADQFNVASFKKRVGSSAAHAKIEIWTNTHGIQWRLIETTVGSIIHSNSWSNGTATEAELRAGLRELTPPA